MTGDNPQQLPADGIPLRVQLDRMRHLGGQLKLSLSRYNQEPQTQEQFVKREILRSRLQILEKRCLEFRNYGGKELRNREKPVEHLQLLIREFRTLEFQIKSFMHG